MPDESVILAGVQADMNAAFGGNMNPALETPQGQLATSITAAIGDANDTFLQYTNEVDPAYADGRMQDAIARIYFLTRKPALPTTTDANCMGAPGTVIPTGTLATATDGNRYRCTAGGVIPIGGTVSLPFACTVTGPIACPATSLSVIYQSIPGWDSINNPADGVLGTNVESRADFEFRREQSVAKNSVTPVGAILGSVADLPDVVDFYGLDNSTNSPVTTRGQTIAANSIYICVSGGTNLDVATAIFKKKAPGCSYTGSTMVTVHDDNPLYATPPAYSVSFQRPTALPILFAVDIINSVIVPADAEAQVQAAIINAFAGGDGGSRARIGSTLLASRYYIPVASLGPWAQILSILLGPTTPTLTNYDVDINKIPTITAGDITVTFV